MDQRRKIEIELWLKPDGIVFDDKTLRRRQKAKLDANTQARVVSAEIFVVNKLARPDKRVTDEQDVKSVLVRQENKLDKKYLLRKPEKLE